MALGAGAPGGGGTHATASAGATAGLCPERARSCKVRTHSPPCAANAAAVFAGLSMYAAIASALVCWQTRHDETVPMT
eukprot:5612986-Heterocapsa_arctica.AAC.1